MVNSCAADLNMVFGALADPTRRAILSALVGGERTVGAVAEPFDISLPAVTKHLNVLEDARLISRRSVGRQKYCRVEPIAMKEAFDWLNYYHQFWNERLDDLEDFLAQD